MCGRGGSGWLQLFPSEPKQPVCFLGNSARESVLLSTFTRMHKQNKRLIELEIWLKTFSGENEFEQVCANGKRNKFTKWNGCKYLLICQTLPHQMISLLNGLGKRKRRTRNDFFFLDVNKKKEKGGRQTSKRTHRPCFLLELDPGRSTTPTTGTFSFHDIWKKKKKKKSTRARPGELFFFIVVLWISPGFHSSLSFKIFFSRKTPFIEGKVDIPAQPLFFSSSFRQLQREKQLSVTRKCYSLSSVFSVRQ